MFPKILTQIFGSRNDRLLKTYRRTVESINALEPRFEQLHVGQNVIDDDNPRCHLTFYCYYLTIGRCFTTCLDQ